MTGYDVIIVGGGPAGSTCARDLVRAGMRVAVIDRATFPRDKCCAGWITPQVLAALDVQPAPYARARTLQPITGFRTSVIGAPPVTTTFGRIVSYAIRRREFDQFLLERSGATPHLGRPVRRIARGADAWTVDDAVTAPMIVGAGGHFCPVAGLLNEPSPPSESVVLAQGIECRMTRAEADACDVAPGVPELFFCPDRQGYGWCVRKWDWLNIGFGHLGDTQFATHRHAFTTELQRGNRRLPGLHGPWRGHAYRLSARPRRRVADAGVVLIGDAAGLADPVSGEGILAAVESGRLAARVILDANGHYTREHLEAYPEAVDRRFGTVGLASLSARLPRGLMSRVTVGLLATRWFTRHVLLGRWFLHTHRSPLLAES